MHTQQRLPDTDVNRANRVVEDKVLEILRCTILHEESGKLQRIQSCWRPTVKLHKRSSPPFELEHFCLPPHLYCMQSHHKVSDSISSLPYTSRRNGYKQCHCKTRAVTHVRTEDETTTVLHQLKRSTGEKPRFSSKLSRLFSGGRCEEDPRCASTKPCIFQKEDES